MDSSPVGSYERQAIRDRELRDEQFNALMAYDAPRLKSYNQFFSEEDEEIVEFVVRLFWKYLPVPLVDLYLVPRMHESNFCNLHENSNLFKVAATVFYQEYNWLPPIDYLDKLKEEDVKYTAQFSMNVNYAPAYHSSGLIKAWLQYQFEDEWDSVLRTIYKVVTLQNGKKNTIHFWGDSNSGKTETMMPLAKLFMFVSFLNGSLVENYPLSSLHRKHFCYWDDAILPDNKCLRKTVMALCGGQSTIIHAENKDSFEPKRMPVIVCSNNEDVFPMHEQQWSDRIIQFKTKALPESMQLDNPIHPMGWLDMWLDVIKGFPCALP